MNLGKEQLKRLLTKDCLYWVLYIAFRDLHLNSLLSDKQYTKLQYRVRTGHRLNLKAPRNYNEKVQWLKLYDHNPLYTTIVDKYAVKDYIRNIIGEQYVIKTLGVWDRFDEIDFEKLPNQFVLKTTHGGGNTGVVICRDKRSFDMKAAKAKGVKISCDLNYRGKLWTRDEARKAMTDLCQYVDVCISNEEDAKDVFGIEAEGTDIYGGKLNHDGYKSVAKQLADKFGFEKVAITLRTSISASDNDWAGMLYDGEDYYFSKSYHLHIVDRVGGGDSFGGGLIYSILSGKSSKDAIEFAVAASALKHSVEGDYNRVSVAEVEKLAGGDGSGRVQR